MEEQPKDVAKKNSARKTKRFNPSTLNNADRRGNLQDEDTYKPSLAQVLADNVLMHLFQERKSDEWSVNIVTYAKRKTEEALKEIGKKNSEYSIDHLLFYNMELVSIVCERELCISIKNALKETLSRYSSYRNSDFQPYMEDVVLLSLGRLKAIDKVISSYDKQIDEVITYFQCSYRGEYIGSILFDNNPVSPEEQKIQNIVRTGIMDIGITVANSIYSKTFKNDIYLFITNIENFYNAIVKKVKGD